MAAIPPKVIETVKQFLTKISSEIPVKKAILFGSFAKGTFDKNSDVDLAIFSDYFEKVSRVEGTIYLFIQAQEFDLDLEPRRHQQERFLLLLDVWMTGSQEISRSDMNEKLEREKEKTQVRRSITHERA